MKSKIYEVDRHFITVKYGAVLIEVIVAHRKIGRKKVYELMTPILPLQDGDKLEFGTGIRLRKDMIQPFEDMVYNAFFEANNIPEKDRVIRNG